MTTIHTVGVPPQPQVMTHQQQQQQTITYQTVQAQPQHGAVVSRYSSSAARITGYTQVVCGVISVAIGITAIVLDCSISFVASPIWSGIGFFIVAGILGIASAANQNSCTIVAHMVMSILSSLAAFQMMSILIVAAFTEFSHCSYYSYYYSCPNRYGRIIVDSIGCIVALVEFVVSIIAAAICCSGSCGNGTIATQQTVVHQLVPNHGNLTIMTSPQPYNQVMPVQHGYAQQPSGYAMSPPQQAYTSQPPNMAPQHVPGIPEAMVSPPPYYQMENKPGSALPNPQV